MNVRRAGLWITGSTLLRLVTGLLTVKLIAEVCGPQGLGQLGQLMSLISICVLLAAGGIQNGIVTRLSAQLHARLDTSLLLGTAVLIGCVWAALATAVLAVLAPTLAESLFGDIRFAYAIGGLAVIQILLAYSALSTGTVNGAGDSVSFAKLSAMSAGLGLAGLAAATWFGSVHGAAWGLVWSAACPALVYAFRDWRRSTRVPRISFDKTEALLLSRFGLMLLVSVVCMPLVQMLLRGALVEKEDWTAVGNWQAVLRFSETSMQFVTVLLSSWFLPRVTNAVNAGGLRQVVNEAYSFVVPLLAAIAAAVLIGGEFLIHLLFSREFGGAVPLLRWQVAGDCLRGLALVIGFIGMSRGNMGLHLAAETLQGGLFLALGWLWIGERGALGVVQAYVATYAIYLPASLMAYWAYLRHLKKSGAP